MIDDIYPAQNYLDDLIKKVKNKNLKKMLKAIDVPELDGYMDWNDREDFYENEYKDWVKRNAEVLEKLAKEIGL